MKNIIALGKMHRSEINLVILSFFQLIMAFGWTDREMLY